MSELAVDVARFADHGSDPPVLANSGKYYSKNVSGTIHWFYESDAGVVYQLTPVTPTTGSVTYTALDNVLTIGTDNVLSNSTAAQSIFGAPNDTFTLLSDTTYLMHMLWQFTFATAVGSYNTLLEFDGTAVYTINYTSIGYNHGSTVGGGTCAGVYCVHNSAVQPSFNAVYTTTNGLIGLFEVEGILVVSAGGTFVPTMQWTVAPGGVSTPVMRPESFCELTPLGDATFVKSGGWV